MSKQPCVPIVVKLFLFLHITHSSSRSRSNCCKDYMLQLYFANIDFLFVLFHVSLCCLLAYFSLNTFRCLFCFASFSRKFKYAFCSIYKYFYTFFLVCFTAIFSLSWESVCVCLTIICLVELFPSVSVSVIV